MHRTRPLPALSPLLLAALLTLPLAATARAQDELVDVVPADACLMVHGRADPSTAFVDECAMQVVGALKGAHVDELVLDVLAAMDMPPEELSRFRALFAFGRELIGSVDWHALTAHEVVFAEVMEQPLPDWIGAPSFLVGFRPAAQDVPGLERSLADLLTKVAGVHDDLLFESNETSGEATHVYRLRYYPAWGHPVIVSLAVRDDRIVAGFGEKVFDHAVALLSGDASDSLVRTERYRNAFGPLSPDASQVTYTDITGLIEGALEDVQEQVKGEPVAAAILDDLAGLARGAGTVVETSRAEGLQLIHETWRQPDAEAEGSCLAACMAVDPSSELLDYVPADAWSFHMTSGLDLRPLYQWFLGRFKAYVPKAGDKLLAYQALLAAADIDVEQDILSWVGSPAVLMTMPARSGAPGAPDDWLWICKLRDPAGARKILDRLGAIYEVTVPAILARLQEEMHGSPFVPRVSVGPSEGAFPMLTTAHLSMVQPFAVTFGLLGDLFVVTSSDATLTSALAVAAGEAPGLEDNRPLQEVGGLPDGPLYAASLTPYARDHAKALVEMSQLTGALDMGVGLALGPAARKDPRVAAITRAVHGVLGRVVDIMRASDFRHHGVAWSRAGPDGRGRYCRDTTLYKSREEREALLVQSGH